MVTVVIPTYNYGHLIAQTIDSLLAQSYGDLDIIVVDDGSTDNTKSVVQEFVDRDKRVRYFLQENAGPSVARNFAINQAKGDFIQFLDADDILQPEKFSLQIAEFGKDPSIDVVYGSVRYFTGNPQDESSWLFTYWGQSKEWMPKIQGQGKEILTTSLKGSFAHISCFLFRASIVRKTGGWDNTLRAAEDYHFVLKCVLEGARFAYRDLPGARPLVRWHGNNTSRNVDWLHRTEREMRLALHPRIEATGNKEAIEANLDAIKALQFMTEKGWRSKLLSGGPFDFLKKILRLLGLEKFARRFFYK